MTTTQRAGRSYGLHIELGTGFCDHTVVIVIDAREVYRRSKVTTDPVKARADALEITPAAPTVHVDVSVAPGNLCGSIACDTTVHRRMVISLIGEATLNLETFA